MPDHEAIAVLFVCLGNICRSPTAEVVMRHQLKQSGLEHRVQVDSAGTGAWHIGHPPDQRAMQAAAGRGYDMVSLRARRVSSRDLEAFDYIVAMDSSNQSDLQAMASAATQRSRICLMGDFSPAHVGQSVPDPYHGGTEGFAHVLDMIEDCVAGLIRRLESS